MRVGLEANEDAGLEMTELGCELDAMAGQYDGTDIPRSSSFFVQSEGKIRFDID